jgi:CRP-like cAMP-binding protein
MTAPLRKPTAELVGHLRRFSVFRDFEPAELESVARTMHVREFARREPIYLPTDDGGSIHFLIDGCVKVTRFDPLTGKEVILYLVRPGELFGFLPRADASANNTSGIALQRAVVGRLSRRDFDRLERTHEFSIELNRVVGQRLVKVATRIDDLVFGEVPARLARLLMRLYSEFPGTHAGAPAIDLALTQQDLADLIGATRERTNNALSQFKRQGLIHYRRGAIELRDRRELGEIAG